MRRVILESPFQGKPENVAYARRCLADCLRRGEAPFASHLLYPGTLNDDNAADRRLGMDAGHAWRDVAIACVVYCDLGLTAGMNEGIARSRDLGMSIEFRALDAPKPDQ